MPAIGIIGYGKMGRDIFGHCLKQPELTDITVYCRHDADKYEEKAQKELSKGLKRKMFTEEQYSAKSAGIHFTGNMNDLSDCDIIIESVSEDLALKQEIFRQLSGIVKPECILTTNTSSLDADEVFADCPPHIRRMGLHFFYPVKMTSFAEINLPAAHNMNGMTIGEDIDRVQEFLRILKKKGLVLEGCYRIYLNQIINAAVSHGIMIQSELGIGVMQCRDALSDMFPMHGLMGMIDGIGLDLLANNTMENCCSRLRPLMDYGTERMKKWLADGCSGAPNSFFDTLDEAEFADKTLPDDVKEQVCLSMTAFILQETVTAAREYAPDTADPGNASQEHIDDTQLMISAVCDTLGIDGELSAYYKKYGYDKIAAELEALYEKTGMECYKPSPVEIFDFCFV